MSVVDSQPSPSLSDALPVDMPPIPSETSVTDNNYEMDPTFDTPLTIPTHLNEQTNGGGEEYPDDGPPPDLPESRAPSLPPSQAPSKLPSPLSSAPESPRGSELNQLGGKLHTFLHSHHQSHHSIDSNNPEQPPMIPPSLPPSQAPSVAGSPQQSPPRSPRLHSSNGMLLPSSGATTPTLAGPPPPPPSTTNSRFSSRPNSTVPIPTLNIANLGQAMKTLAAGQNGNGIHVNPPPPSHPSLTHPPSTGAPPLVLRPAQPKVISKHTSQPTSQPRSRQEPANEIFISSDSTLDAHPPTTAESGYPDPTFSGDLSIPAHLANHQPNTDLDYPEDGPPPDLPESRAPSLPASQAPSKLPSPLSSAPESPRGSELNQLGGKLHTFLHAHHQSHHSIDSNNPDQPPMIPPSLPPSQAPSVAGSPQQSPPRSPRTQSSNSFIIPSSGSATPTLDGPPPPPPSTSSSRYSSRPNSTAPTLNINDLLKMNKLAPSGTGLKLSATPAAPLTKPSVVATTSTPTVSRILRPAQPKSTPSAQPPTQAPNVALETKLHDQTKLFLAAAAATTSPSIKSFKPSSLTEQLRAKLTASATPSTGATPATPQTASKTPAAFTPQPLATPFSSHYAGLKTNTPATTVLKSPSRILNANSAASPKTFTASGSAPETAAVYGITFTVDHAIHLPLLPMVTSNGGTPSTPRMTLPNTYVSFTLQTAANSANPAGLDKIPSNPQQLQLFEYAHTNNNAGFRFAQAVSPPNANKTGHFDAIRTINAITDGVDHPNTRTERKLDFQTPNKSLTMSQLSSSPPSRSTPFASPPVPSNLTDAHQQGTTQIVYQSVCPKWRHTRIIALYQLLRFPIVATALSSPSAPLATPFQGAASVDGQVTLANMTSPVKSHAYPHPYTGIESDKNSEFELDTAGLISELESMTIVAQLWHRPLPIPTTKGLNTALYPPTSATEVIPQPSDELLGTAIIPLQILMKAPTTSVSGQVQSWYPLHGGAGRQSIQLSISLSPNPLLRSVLARHATSLSTRQQIVRTIALETIRRQEEAQARQKAVEDAFLAKQQAVAEAKRLAAEEEARIAKAKLEQAAKEQREIEDKIQRQKQREFDLANDPRLTKNKIQSTPNRESTTASLRGRSRERAIPSASPTRTPARSLSGVRSSSFETGTSSNVTSNAESKSRDPSISKTHERTPSTSPAPKPSRSILSPQKETTTNDVAGVDGDDDVSDVSSIASRSPSPSPVRSPKKATSKAPSLPASSSPSPSHSTHASPERRGDALSRQLITDPFFQPIELSDVEIDEDEEVEEADDIKVTDSATLPVDQTKFESDLTSALSTAEAYTSPIRPARPTATAAATPSTPFSPTTIEDFTARTILFDDLRRHMVELTGIGDAMKFKYLGIKPTVSTPSTPNQSQPNVTSPPKLTSQPAIVSPHPQQPAAPIITQPYGEMTSFQKPVPLFADALQPSQSIPSSSPSTSTTSSSKSTDEIRPVRSLPQSQVHRSPSASPPLGAFNSRKSSDSSTSRPPFQKMPSRKELLKAKSEQMNSTASNASGSPANSSPRAHIYQEPPAPQPSRSVPNTPARGSFNTRASGGSQSSSNLAAPPSLSASSSSNSLVDHAHERERLQVLKIQQFQVFQAQKDQQERKSARSASPATPAIAIPLSPYQPPMPPLSPQSLPILVGQPLSSSSFIIASTLSSHRSHSSDEDADQVLEDEVVNKQGTPTTESLGMNTGSTNAAGPFGDYNTAPRPTDDRRPSTLRATDLSLLGPDMRRLSSLRSHSDSSSEPEDEANLNRPDDVDENDETESIPTSSDSDEDGETHAFTSEVSQVPMNVDVVREERLLSPVEEAITPVSAPSPDKPTAITTTSRAHIRHGSFSVELLAEVRQLGGRPKVTKFPSRQASIKAKDEKNAAAAAAEAMNGTSDLLASAPFVVQHPHKPLTAADTIPEPVISEEEPIIAPEPTHTPHTVAAVIESVIHPHHHSHQQSKPENRSASPTSHGSNHSDGAVMSPIPSSASSLALAAGTPNAIPLTSRDLVELQAAVRKLEAERHAKEAALAQDWTQTFEQKWRERQSNTKKKILTATRRHTIMAGMGTTKLSRSSSQPLQFLSYPDPLEMIPSDDALSSPSTGQPTASPPVAMPFTKLPTMAE